MKDIVLKGVKEEQEKVEVQIELSTLTLEAMNELQVPGALSQNIAAQIKQLELQLELNKKYLVKLDAVIAKAEKK